ncbi:MAG: acetyl-CoA carboxylase carboxyltransferase subunit alpha [Candidatus Hatepunaea meridiana]|nr:acetyl-CoA carboxylase carboxyltransferase subunit alpha [Candidatus Hatepunaea meridiana]
MKKHTLEFEKPLRELETKINELETISQSGKIGIEKEITKLRRKLNKLHRDTYANLSRWQCVQLARHPNRPYTLDYIKLITTDFVEFKGDRNFRDDKAIIAGIGRWNDQPVAIIGHQKGRGTKDNLKRNFGMSHPEGYRKALRIMKLAEKFGLPVITLIDTPGAYPGLGAEERGQASAIAENLMAMANLKVPIIAVVIGEGGSGGALALGIADRVYMLQYAIYSVISPEGCASILYRDAAQAPQAADAMKITASDLLEFGIVDGLIEEPLGGAHYDPEMAASVISKTVTDALDKLKTLNPKKRIKMRINKYMKMGQWIEN